MLFAGAACAAAMQFRHLARCSSSSVIHGSRMRDIFVALLSAGSMARSVSLAAILYILRSSSSSELSSVKLWRLFLLDAVPSFLFLTAYSLVVLFWAQVFYATILVAADSLRTFFFAANSLVVIAFIAVTLLVKDPQRFNAVIGLLIGASYVVVGGFFAYYGVQVAGQLSADARHTRTRTSLVRRIVLLSVVCPLLFEIRGIVCIGCVVNTSLAEDVNKATPLTPWGWDAIIYLVTEFLPVFLILQVFSPPSYYNADAELTAATTTQQQYSTPLLDSSFVDSFRARQWYCSGRPAGGGGALIGSIPAVAHAAPSQSSSIPNEDDDDEEDRPYRSNIYHIGQSSRTLYATDEPKRKTTQKQKRRIVESSVRGEWPPSSRRFSWDSRYDNDYGENTATAAASQALSSGERRRYRDKFFIRR